MTTSVCTLFERDYHHGVAALVNSLVVSGFRGRIFAGYRGALPRWAQGAERASVAHWHDARVLVVTADCELAFLPMLTDAHFTNLKPDFMLELFSAASLGIERLFYLDPDVCVVERWPFFEDWISCGVALCEDVNSPLEKHHPRRVGWRRHFCTYGISLEYRTPAYVNGGCVGVSRQDVGFLKNWQRLSGYMTDAIGGLGASMLEGGAQPRQWGFAGCFDRTDQDALNAAVEMSAEFDYSILSRAAMAFSPGSAVVPHAVGLRKPWRRQYLRDALRAMAPTAADKAFWRFVGGPLFTMSTARAQRARLSLGLATVMGRLYRRA